MKSDGSKIETVLGPVRTEKLKICLPHEHICCYGPNHASICFRRNLLSIMVPKLVELRTAFGCNAMVECTNTAGMGRDVETYAEVARASGFHVIASTGFFGEARSTWWMEEASVAELVRRWKSEARHGVDGTGIRPGILKGSSGPEIGDKRRKHHHMSVRWLKALARAHHETGLPITTHTCGPVCGTQLELLMREGVPPAAVAAGHADHKGELEHLLPVVDAGGFVLINFCAGFRAPHKAVYRRDLNMVKALINRGYTERILLSVDAVYLYDRSNRSNPTITQKKVNGKRAPYSREYRDLFKRIIPDLVKTGVPPARIRQICEANPKLHLAGPWD